MIESRRVRYTKGLIKEALIELMQQYSIEEISIKKLCDSAEVNRSTFYAHYRNVREVLEEISEATYLALKKYIRENEATGNKHAANQMILKLILDYALKEQRLFEVLLSDRGDVDFQNDILLLLDDFANEERTLKDKTAENFLRIYAVSGTISVVKEWLTNGTKESTMYVSELLTNLNKR